MSEISTCVEISGVEISTCVEISVVEISTCVEVSDWLENFYVSRNFSFLQRFVSLSANEVSFVEIFLYFTV